MENEKLDVIQTLEEKIVAMTMNLPKVDENSDEKAVKAKRLAVDDLVKLTNALTNLRKAETEDQKVASNHELKLEEYKFQDETQKLKEREMELQEKKLEFDISKDESHLEYDYFAEKARIEEAIRKNEIEARKARAELRHDVISVATTVIGGVFQLGQLRALSDVVNAGGIHMKLLPFIGRK